eukprot:TRINITY_DN7547_c0_g6_i1.p1 TRINITY_DN7547_c0_g6~~TRINITY_DN7547_c0_g6_i1.p1  ORF type:complete len:181 (+),score=41.54 TRINITY_DN7547_c0_g6_i1:456-998(+)
MLEKGKSAVADLKKKTAEELAARAGDIFRDTSARLVGKIAGKNRESFADILGSTARRARDAVVDISRSSVSRAKDSARDMARFGADEIGGVAHRGITNFTKNPELRGALGDRAELLDAVNALAHKGVARVARGAQQKIGAPSVSKEDDDEVNVGSFFGQHGDGLKRRIRGRGIGTIPMRR